MRSVIVFIHRLDVGRHVMSVKRIQGLCAAFTPRVIASLRLLIYLEESGMNVVYSLGLPANLLSTSSVSSSLFAHTTITS